HRVRTRLSTIARATTPVRNERSDRRGRDDPKHGGTKLPLVVARSFLSLGVAVRGADSPVLSRAAAGGGRPCSGGGGLRLYLGRRPAGHDARRFSSRRQSVARNSDLPRRGRVGQLVGS